MFKKKKHSVVGSSSKKNKYDTGQMYNINGVKVQFPVKAYPTQISMMHKILRGLDRKQNCLLESPTGSGKSLALLCSCLAWQAKEKEGAKVEIKETVTAETRNEDIQYDSNINATNCEQVVNGRSKNRIAGLNYTDEGESDTEDFVPTIKMLRTSLDGGLVKIHKENAHPSTWNMELLKSETHQKDTMEQDKLIEQPAKNVKVPKIYFGTRTHKQITQIIRELRKTVYKDVKMTILGSREYMCIHPTVSKGKDKNESCKKLIKGLEGKSCRFHPNAHLFGRYNVKAKYRLNMAWDIEDLVRAGKRIKACPYFGMRELNKGAEIIFCPYNYLIDPITRSQMMINVKGQVIILDEAHNVEDSAREAASVSLTAMQLEETRHDLQNMIDANVMVDAHTCLLMLCDGLLAWIDTVKDQLIKRAFEEEAKVWTGTELVKMFAEEEKLCLTYSAFKLYKNEFGKLISAEHEVNNVQSDSNDIRLNTKSLAILGSIMLVLEKLLNQESDFASDYRVGLSRTSVLTHTSIGTDGGWRRKSKFPEKRWTYQLNLWCLNPAVVFSELGDQARCIILSSGTLSPMNSFSSELGVKFPILLEANHVIEDSQVWVGVLSVGPRNTVLNANFKNSETYIFQDEVGDVLLQISQTVPKGVLCFFSSYSMLDKLVKRWKGTGLWEKLSLLKIVLVEPRGAGKTEFDETLNNFYASVASSTGSSEMNGALLLAVCRGKISEGLDFSDDNARAVLTVGIPFPNLKDIQVELKRKYNNKHCSSRQLLTGNEWYEIQAFRALNQALGRCIRHRHDWGVLLMIDERFSKSSKYRNGLSKWVRSKVQIFNDFQICLSSIAQFALSRFQNNDIDLSDNVDVMAKKQVGLCDHAEIVCNKQEAANNNTFNDVLEWNQRIYLQNVESTASVTSDIRISEDVEMLIGAKVNMLEKINPDKNSKRSDVDEKMENIDPTPMVNSAEYSLLNTQIFKEIEDKDLLSSKHIKNVKHATDLCNLENGRDVKCVNFENSKLNKRKCNYLERCKSKPVDMYLHESFNLSSLEYSGSKKEEHIDMTNDQSFNINEITCLPEQKLMSNSLNNCLKDMRDNEKQKKKDINEISNHSFTDSLVKHLKIDEKKAVDMVNSQSGMNSGTENLENSNVLHNQSFNGSLIQNLSCEFRKKNKLSSSKLTSSSKTASSSSKTASSSSKTASSSSEITSDLTLKTTMASTFSKNPVDLETNLAYVCKSTFKSVSESDSLDKDLSLCVISKNVNMANEKDRKNNNKPTQNKKLKNSTRLFNKIEQQGNINVNVNTVGEGSVTSNEEINNDCAKVDDVAKTMFSLNESFNIRRSKRASLSKKRKSLSTSHNNRKRRSNDTDDLFCNKNNNAMLVDKKEKRALYQCCCCNETIIELVGSVKKSTVIGMANDSKNVYEIDSMDSLVTKDKVVKNHKCSDLNAYFDEHLETLFMPIFCKICANKKDINEIEAIGIKLIHLKSPDKPKVYLYVTGVQCVS